MWIIPILVYLSSLADVARRVLAFNWSPPPCAECFYTEPKPRSSSRNVFVRSFGGGSIVATRRKSISSLYNNNKKKLQATYGRLFDGRSVANQRHWIPQNPILTGGYSGQRRPRRRYTVIIKGANSCLAWVVSFATECAGLSFCLWMDRYTSRRDDWSCTYPIRNRWRRIVYFWANKIKTIKAVAWTILGEEGLTDGGWVLKVVIGDNATRLKNVVEEHLEFRWIATTYFQIYMNR